MLLTINLLLIVLGSAATLSAFGGETWIKDEGPLIERITLRGWVSLVCLFSALILGSIKEFSQYAASSLSERETKLAQESLQQKIDQANRELALSKDRVSEMEKRLKENIAQYTAHIPKEIDYPYYETEYNNPIVISQKTRRPLEVFAGDTIRYDIHGAIEDKTYLPRLLHFVIGSNFYPIFGLSGQLTVYGFPSLPMNVSIINESTLRIAIKMVVISSRQTEE